MYENKKIHVSEGRSGAMELKTTGMDPSELHCDVLCLLKL